MEPNNQDINLLVERMSSKIDPALPRVAIVLAAGHGKRIRSDKSKIVHSIWGVPSVTRVANAVRKGLDTNNQIVVLGNKAAKVADVLGQADGRVFVYQSRQRGTGDAVRVGLTALTENPFIGDLYVFPADMGLLNSDAVRGLRSDFESSNCDMMVLTANFHGDVRENSYGRIIRVPGQDSDGCPSENDAGSVIEIKEHRDILAMSPDAPYTIEYNSRRYNFSRDDLLREQEFNTGVYVFKAEPFTKLIHDLQTDNVQGEFYITDLISIFNRNSLRVGTSRAQDSRTVLGFNNKSVLKKMEKIARNNAYDLLKDIITIADKDDFFLADDVISQIVELDKTAAPLDIEIGKGVNISASVKISKGVKIGNRVVLRGNIVIRENVTIHDNVVINTYPDQTLTIGTRTEILSGDILKGNIEFGEGCRIESGVNITGSDEHPARFGNNVLIKGTTYIFGSIIENDVRIEHSVLKCKYVERTVRKDGSIQPVSWVLPLPEGLDTVRSL